MAKDKKEGRKSTHSFDLSKGVKRSFDLKKMSTRTFDLKKDDSVVVPVNGSQPVVPKPQPVPTPKPQPVPTPQPQPKPTPKPQPKPAAKSLEPETTETSNTHSSSKKWIGILVAVAVVAIVVWLLSGLGSGTDDTSQPSEPTMSTDMTTTEDEQATEITDAEAPESTESMEESGGNEGAPVDTESEEPTQSQPQTSTQSQSQDVTPERQAAQSNPATPQTTVSLATGTAQEVAGDVLKGAYGNGAERRAALGDRYEEVQREVNRWYRNRAQQ